jgi:signal transduction histidine kinase/ActR/RegA family two-component response regulator
MLVVDDEPDILIALGDLFEDAYEVLQASSGADGLELLARHPDVAVIISDQRMPAMTGDQFLEKAREISDAEGILLTGYADFGAVIGAVNRGRIVGYMPKPWDTAALVSMVAGTHERRRLQRELETQHRLLHGVLDSIDGAASFKDTAGRFVELNRRKAEALGVPREAAIGRRESEISDAPGVAEAEAEDIRVAMAGERSDITVEIAGDDGPQWLSRSRLPVHGADGRTEWVVVRERDVTAGKLMEQRLRQAEKLQALGTLAGGIAHDFNNLLAAILGCLELAGRRLPDDPKLQRLVRGATEAAQRGAALTQRLLSFSRQRDLKLEAADCNAVVAGMSDLLEHSLGAVAVSQTLAGDLWPALIDADQLELAVLNLCINARDAMPDGGTIEITTRNAAVARGEVAGVAAGDYVVLSVADTGAGIPPHVLSRVFEPFFTTKETGKGTGLGLSMVYGLVQQAGGGITIDTQPGAGTCVTLYFPRAEAARAAETAVPEVASGGRPLRVLVVDDDAEVRRVTVAYLAALGHDTAEAADGAAALAHLSTTTVDLLVTDYAMPGMTGGELAERARAAEPGLPVLVVTGFAAPDGLPAGCRVLPKPFRQADLAAAIAAVTG